MAAEIHEEYHVDCCGKRRPSEIDGREARQALASHIDIGVDRNDAGIFARQDAIEDEAAIDGGRAAVSLRHIAGQMFERCNNERDPLA